MKFQEKWIYFTAAVLLIIFAVIAVSVALPTIKSATADELAHHIPVGYVLLSKGDFKMDPSQPPLPRYIMALPLKLFLDLKMPDDKEAWRVEDRSEFGRDFFYKYNDNPHEILFYARCAIIVVGVLCGILVFVMAGRFYGGKAALLSLFLYCFCPNIIAHSALATTDMTAAFTTLLAVFSFWLFAGKRTVMTLVLSGFCLGLAQLSKYTALLLYPTFLLLAVLELKTIEKGKRIRFFSGIIAVFVVSFVVLWAGYGFEMEPILYDAMRLGEKLELARRFFGNSVDDFLLKFHAPLGTHILGMLGVIKHGYEGHTTFFCGNVSSHGNPFYFLLAFFIKTPIPAIILIFTAIALMFASGIGRRERFLLVAIAAIFLSASFSKLQLGLRHILPMYPLCFVAAGKIIDLWEKNKIYKSAIAALLGWCAVISFFTWPHYLSYFNELIGGPENGYKYLRDSNLDWGQDLPALAKYMKDNRLETIKLLYTWPADPRTYRISYEQLSREEYLRPGNELYAVSADTAIVAWKEDGKIKPTERLGYSIYVYDFREDR